jgi:hypothetical protein
MKFEYLWKKIANLISLIFSAKKNVHFAHYFKYRTN